jgi:hypothetical protein
MNRFQVTPCVNQSEISEDAPDGLVLPLASEIENNCMLFFPIPDDVAAVINCLLEREDAGPKELQLIEVFKTMTKTWRSGDRFLSGILLDSTYDSELDEEILQTHIVLSSINDGYIESVSKINFVHAMIISVLESVDIMVSNELISKLLPDIFGEDELDDDQLNENIEDLDYPESYPVDKDILKIVKNIMNGKIK